MRPMRWQSGYAPDCNSGHAGSNPVRISRTTEPVTPLLRKRLRWVICGCSSAVERLVAIQKVVGSNPVTRSKFARMGIFTEQ